MFVESPILIASHLENAEAGTWMCLCEGQCSSM